MIKYKAEMYYMPMIKKIEVERETACFVWISGRKESKDCECCRFFDTFVDAKHATIDKIQRKIDYHKDELTILELKRDQIKELTEGDVE